MFSKHKTAGKKKLAKGQMTLSNFFSIKKAEKEVVDIEKEPEQVPVARPPMRSLFVSQNSFDENDIDSEIAFLKKEQGQQLNNFKNSKPLGTLVRSSSTFEKPKNSVDTRETQSFSEKRRKEFDYTQFSVKKPKLEAPRAIPKAKVKKQEPVIDLSSEQQSVIDYIVKDGLNVFYTGSAGTGKSVVLRTLVQRLQIKYGTSAVAVTASTGLAAVNIGGVTIHSFSGIGIGKSPAEACVARIRKNKQVEERWKRTRVLIVDEVSMVDGHFLDKLNTIGQMVRRIYNKPFGGIQIVLTGDFFQLPPVPNRDSQGPQPIFCFQAKFWKQTIQKTILLHKVFRQKDNDLIDMLNGIRMGEAPSHVHSIISSLSREVKYEDGIQPTELFPTRREVEASNVRRLQDLPGSMFLFRAIDQAKDEMQAKMLDNLLAEKELRLKEDAQVMMIRNVDETLVNGSVGKVLFFISELLMLRVMEQFPGVLWEDFIPQMRLLSRCVGLLDSQRPPEVVQALTELSAAEAEKFTFLLNIAGTESRDKMWPMVRFTTTGGPRYQLVKQEDFTIDLPTQNTSITRSQLPLILCWAVSIHKAQGQTLDRLKVDLRKIFEMGQVYVALSRAVSKDRLQIVNFDSTKIRASPVVKEFYASLQML